MKKILRQCKRKEKERKRKSFSGIFAQKGNKRKGNESTKGKSVRKKTAIGGNFRQVAGYEKSDLFGGRIFANFSFGFPVRKMADKSIGRA